MRDVGAGMAGDGMRDVGAGMAAVSVRAVMTRQRRARRIMGIAFIVGR